MIATRVRGALAAALLVTFMSAGGAAAAAAPVTAHPGTGAAWGEFAASFVEDSLRADPFFAVQAGRHEFDGRMPDWSAAGIGAEVARLHRAREAIQAFDAAALTAGERFEREYLLAVVDRELFWRERARSPFTNPAWYLDQLDPDVYLNRDYAPLAKRMQGYIGYARAVPRIAADIRANLRTPLPATFVQRALDGFGGFAQFFRHDVPKVFASVKDPAAQRDLAAANESAAAAMDGLKRWFEGEQPRATQAFALGAPLFLEMLKATERVELPLARLEAAGRADLERNTEALRAACAQYAPHATLQSCVARVQADKPAGGALEGARRQLAQLREFVIARRIVSVPGNERPQVIEAPPYNRSNFAYILVPGPYERGVAYEYAIAPPDPAWTPAERAAYIPGKADLLYTSVHEVWPGHFVQFLHSNRNPSRVAALWVGYAYAEGWAHYCEEMMWEEGLGEGDAEQHIGQLLNALLRNVRFLSAIGLHTGSMTVEQSERMFRERAYSDPGNARQQAARGTFDPQYLDYTLGKLMIRKLREDWVALQSPAGSDSSGDSRRLWREFHDRFLSYGGPPIPLVRKAMLGEDRSALF